MCQKIVISAFILLAFCFTEATAQEPVSVVSLPAPVFKTKYERFVSPPDKIFITESYPIAGFKNGYRVSVLVSYAFGEKHRVYGASFGERIIDFQQLEPLRKRLDEIIQTIKSFDQSDLASVNYHLPQAFSVSYYSWNDSGDNKVHHNLYLVIGTDIEQSPNALVPLEKLRDFVAKARAEIISQQTKQLHTTVKSNKILRRPDR